MKYVLQPLGMRMMDGHYLACPSQVHCCGVKNYTDWSNTTFSKGVNVPDSCCKEYTVGCGLNMLLSPADAEDRLYTVGCVPELSEQVKHKAGVFAGIGVGIAFIQVTFFISIRTCRANRP